MDGDWKRKLRTLTPPSPLKGEGAWGDNGLGATEKDNPWIPAGACPREGGEHAGMTEKTG